jgi:hypothetical protein
LKKELEVASASAGGGGGGGGGGGDAATEILARHGAQGAVVSNLKKAKADKSEITSAVAVLVSIKKEYKDLTGEDVPRADGNATSKKPKKVVEAPTAKATTVVIDDEKSAKKAVKKAAKDAEKAKKAAEKAAKAEMKRKEQEEAAERRVEKLAGDADKSQRCQEFYGDAPLLQSSSRVGVVYSHLKNFNAAAATGEEVLVRARVDNSRKQGKAICFLTLRRQVYSVQAVIMMGDSVDEEFVNFCDHISQESVVDITGKLVKCEPTNTTQSDVELHVSKLFVISRAAPRLPMQLSDAARKEGDPGTVAQNTRLDNRYIDLRTMPNQAIMKVQAGVCRYFREYLTSDGFQEIHSPKIISAASEGGANVFKVGYFGADAFMAQSPQLYKQMAINSDLDRVFEIAPGKGHAILCRSLFFFLATYPRRPMTILFITT